MSTEDYVTFFKCLCIVEFTFNGQILGRWGGGGSCCQQEYTTVFFPCSDIFRKRSKRFRRRGITLRILGSISVSFVLACNKVS